LFDNESMNRPLTAFAALLAAAATAASGTLQQQLPSAESILDRYIEVSGGKAAYANLKNLSLSGKIEMPDAGLSGTLTAVSAEPDFSRTTVEFPGAGRFETGTGAGRAWQLNPVQGARLLAGAELKRTLRLYRFNAAFNWRGVYSKVVTEAEEDVAGKPCYRLLLTAKDGEAPDTAWYDKQSGLVVKTRLTLPTEQGDVTMESEPGDYRDVGGIKFPFSISQKVGPQSVKVTFGEARINSELPAGVFDLPEAIQQLVK
jgi:hypothetical protein